MSKTFLQSLEPSQKRKLIAEIKGEENKKTESSGLGALIVGVIFLTMGLGLFIGLDYAVINEVIDTDMTDGMLSYLTMMFMIAFSLFVSIALITIFIAKQVKFEMEKK